MLPPNITSLTITPEILQLVSKIDEFKGQWLALGKISRERLTQLKKTATIESVGSSTRIEGAKLSDREVEELLSNLKIESFQSRDEEEVAGYAAAMDLIFESWEHLKISENHIKQLHNTLLQFSSKDKRHRGDYKTLANNVAAFDAERKQIGIVFETSEPFDTASHMAELVAWVESVEKDEQLHPLLITGIFIVRFLVIHPFQDGNGRISRVLTTLLLIRHGYDHIPYASLERIIEDNKELYYKALRATEASFNAEEADWQPWLLFFLRSLLRHAEFLKKKLLQEDQNILDQLPPSTVQILNLFDTHERITVRETTDLTGINRNTVKASLSRLVALEKIKQQGKGRSVYYTL